MGEKTLRVAHELLKNGPARGSRRKFLSSISMNDNTFRAPTNGGAIGAISSSPGEAFFDSSGRNSLAFGPGAGLVVGASIGTESLRAAIFDANGDHYHLETLPPEADQLKAAPEFLLERIKLAIQTVIGNALEEGRLTIDGELPLLGVSVAWPSALDRKKYPVGNALKDEGWMNGPVYQRMARQLKLDPERCHAVNDVNAAAISVAFDKTQQPDHKDHKYARLTAVLRLAGGVGGATVVIEPHEDGQSGFIKTILLGGVDSLAGEIGHVEVPQEVVSLVNEDLPSGLEEMQPVYCSCVTDGKPVPRHLESLISANAAARRMGKKVKMSEAIASLHENPTSKVNERILENTGLVLGRALMSPIAWLNPAEIVLTGSMAVPEIRGTMAETIADSHPAVTKPRITVLQGEENDLVRARGAALVVIRRHVFKKFDTILQASDAAALKRNVRRLTQRVKDPTRLGG